MKWLDNLDMVKCQIMNFLVHLLATDPTGVEGQMYHNTTNHIPKIHNGTSWINYLLENRLGAASGAASLDSNGKIPIAQIPSSVANGMDYQGSCDASGGVAPTPTKKGDFWIISVAGTISTVSYKVGDWIVSRDGATTWDKIDNQQTISSVFGRIGAVIAAAGDYIASQITNTPAGNITSVTVQAALNELDTKKQAALISGNNIKTINGNSLLGSGDIVISGGATKYTATIGDGTTTAITVTHNLNTRNIIAQVYDATTYAQVMCDIVATTVNTATFTFATAPTSGQYFVVVI